MTLALERSALQAPATLVDSGQGFRAHPLDLAPHEEREYHAALAEGLAKVAISGAAEIYDDNNDQETLDHGKRVASIALGGGIRLGLPHRDLVTGVVGDVLHDIGKEGPRIQAAIHSPYTFEEKPELIPIVRSHAEEGYWTLREPRYHLGPNVPIFSLAHHGRQTSRAPYGWTGPITGLPEADGYRPDLETLISLTAEADPFDGLSVDIDESGRLYRTKAGVSVEAAVRAMNTVKAPDTVRQAVYDVVVRPQLELAA